MWEQGILRINMDKAFWFMRFLLLQGMKARKICSQIKILSKNSDFRGSEINFKKTSYQILIAIRIKAIATRSSINPAFFAFVESLRSAFTTLIVFLGKKKTRQLSIKKSNPTIIKTEFTVPITHL
jgi:hypothetical protein